jgi:hypothetical protein
LGSGARDLVGGGEDGVGVGWGVRGKAGAATYWWWEVDQGGQDGKAPRERCRPWAAVAGGLAGVGGGGSRRTRGVEAEV